MSDSKPFGKILGALAGGLATVLAAVFTPLGEKISDALFPFETIVEGSIRSGDMPLRE